RKSRGEKIIILSDSLSAIYSLNMRPGELTSAEIIACKNSLSRSTCKITVGWIKGHDNNSGNEYADDLVKEGARRGTPVSVPISMRQTKMLSDKQP
ncbi:Putative loa-9 aae, partial [Caligus rogercresseyi]